MFRTTSLRHGSAGATAAGIGAILLWSTAVALARRLSEQVGPITAAAAVTAISSVAPLLSLLLRRQKRRELLQLPLRYLVGCGTLFAGYTVCLYLALGWARSRQEVLEVGLINYLWPTLTLVFSLVLIGKKATWALLPGTLLALGGVSLVANHQAHVGSWLSLLTGLLRNPGAYSLAIVAAVAWAAYSNLTRRWAGERSDGAVALFLPVTALVLALICCFVDEPRSWTARSLTEALFLGISVYVSYSWWDMAMRRGDVVMVAAASYLTPFLSTVVSCCYLAVVPGAQLWVGCGLLVVGSFVSWRSVKTASAEAPE